MLKKDRAEDRGILSRLLNLFVAARSLPKQRVYWTSTTCPCCGGHIRRRFPVMGTELSEGWELTQELQTLFDHREGTICISCGANLRVMELARCLLSDIGKLIGQSWTTVRQMAADSSTKKLSIAEINYLPGLHKNIQHLPGLVYSEYGGENSQDLLALTYPDNEFDYVLTSETLEHVPDFDRAMSEISRVLKPGGKHIFTIPVIPERKTRQRASIVDGKIVHHFPPTYHGSQQSRAEDLIVFNEFGGDVIERISQAGFTVTVDNASSNRLAITVIAEKT